MQSARFLTTRREWLLGLAGAALASSKVRNGMYNPELAAHTSIWLAEAEVRHEAVADVLAGLHVGRGAEGGLLLRLQPELRKAGEFQSLHRRHLKRCG